jgi:serine/threonine protein kinase
MERRAAMAGSGPLAQGSKLQNGKYIIEEVLGEGGFGITYRATDALLGRTVAIKELYPEGSERKGELVTVPITYAEGRWRKAITDFLREARTLASLDYPGIVTVHDYFEENNTAYMVMRFIDGVDLVKLMIQRGGRLPEAEALRYISEVGEALSLLHARGVLHRDIKPSNILVNRQGHAVLVDFGAAREFITNQAITHTVIASYGFAPPEQFHARARRGPYTDVYSLAATCYYLLTGTLPTQEAVEEGQIRPELRAALEHAMAYNPEQRPQDVSTFVAELQGRIPPPVIGPQTHMVGGSPAATRDLSVPADYSRVDSSGGVPQQGGMSATPPAAGDYQRDAPAIANQWPPATPPFASPPVIPPPPPPATSDAGQRGAPGR